MICSAALSLYLKSVIQFWIGFFILMFAFDSENKSLFNGEFSLWMTKCLFNMQIVAMKCRCVVIKLEKIYVWITILSNLWQYAKNYIACLQFRSLFLQIAPLALPFVSLSLFVYFVVVFQARVDIFSSVSLYFEAAMKKMMKGRKFVISWLLSLLGSNYIYLIFVERIYIF